jgi:hypothetical protein
MPGTSVPAPNGALGSATILVGAQAGSGSGKFGVKYLMPIFLTHFERGRIHIQPRTPRRRHPPARIQYSAEKAEHNYGVARGDVPQSQPVGSTAGGVLTAAYGPPKDTSGSLSIPRSIGESLGRQYGAPVNGVVRFGSRQGHAAALRDHLTADRVIGAGLIPHRKRLLSVGGMGAGWRRNRPPPPLEP